MEFSSGPRLLACLAVVVAASGCGALEGNPYRLESSTIGTPLERALVFDRAVSPLRGVAVDAKQRFVWSPRIPVRTIASDGAGGIHADVERRSIVCAEPSPDALSAIASTINAELRRNRPGGDGNAGETSASLAGSLSETVQAIGDRTQVVQLLRDTLYRACEAYANGALDDFGYAVILGQIDLFMLQLLSADALGKARGREDVAEQRALRNQERLQVQRIRGDLQRAEARLQDLETRVGRTRIETAASVAREARQAELQARQESLRSRKAELEGPADAAGSIAHTKETLAEFDAAEAEAEALQPEPGADETDEARAAREAAERKAEIKASSRRHFEDKLGRDESELSDIVEMLEVVDGNLAEVHTEIAGQPPAAGDSPTEDDIAAARGAVSDLQQQLGGAEGELANAEVALAKATEGAGPGPAEVHALDKLIRISFLAASDGSLPGRVTQSACLQWFARNPQVKMDVGPDQELGDLHPLVTEGEVPAIAVYCHEFLELKTDKDLAKELREFELKRAAQHADAHSDDDTPDTD